jgi:hypothetical protein
VTVTLLVLVGVLVAADRIAAGVAGARIASRVRTSEGLATTPDVSIRGFPFLTQVVTGHYGDISVTAHGLRRDGLLLQQVQVSLRGVRVRLGDVASGSLPDIPVDRGTAAVSVTYPDLNSYLADRRLTVGDAGGALRVTGSVTVPVLGRVSLSAPLRLSASGETLTLVPEAVHSVAGVLPSPARAIAVELLTIRVSLHGLPFGVRLDQAQVTPDGLRIAASARDITLPSTGTTNGCPPGIPPPADDL